MRIELKLNNMYGDEYFAFDNMDDLAEAVVFFVHHGKSFTVDVIKEDKENENGDK